MTFNFLKKQKMDPFHNRWLYVKETKQPQRIIYFLFPQDQDWHFLWRTSLPLEGLEENWTIITVSFEEDDGGDGHKWMNILTWKKNLDTKV